MRAVVVYESMYGNTHLVADAIGTGLETAFDVWVVPVSQADQAVLDGADRHDQPLRDLPVGQPTGRQRDDLPFAGGQRQWCGDSG